MSKRGRKSHYIPTIQPVVESVVSYKNHECILNLCSADEIFDRFKYDNNLMFKRLRQNLLQLDDVYVREDDCLCNLGLGKRPYVNTHVCVGCFMLRNLFPGVKIPEDGTFTVQVGKYEGKKVQIFEYDENFTNYSNNENLNLLFQEVSQLQIKSSLINEEQFVLNKKIKISSTNSRVTNYILTSIFMNNKMNKYKIPNHILLDWSYSCSNKIKTVKTVHYTYSGLSNLDILNKNIKSATAQVKISPLNDNIVFAVLKQLVCILHFYSKYSFIHGRPCIEYLNFTFSHCKYKYGDMEIDSPVTLHIDPSLYTSFSYENDDKSNTRLVSFSEIDEIPKIVDIPVESIDILIQQNSKQNNDNYEIPLMMELKKNLTYCYKIGNRKYDFLNYQIKYGVFVSESFDFYCFLISLIFEDSFYATFMENEKLIHIWENLWKRSELEDVNEQLDELKKKDSLSYGDIVNFVSNYYLRCDVINFFYDSLI